MILIFSTMYKYLLVTPPSVWLWIQRAATRRRKTRVTLLPSQQRRTFYLSTIIIRYVHTYIASHQLCWGSQIKSMQQPSGELWWSVFLPYLLGAPDQSMVNEVPKWLTVTVSCIDLTDIHPPHHIFFVTLRSYWLKPSTPMLTSLVERYQSGDSLSILGCTQITQRQGMIGPGLYK